MTTEEMLTMSREWINEDPTDDQIRIFQNNLIANQWRMTAELCNRLEALTALILRDQLPSRTHDEPK